MSGTITIMNNGAPIKVLKVLAEKKVKKDGTVEKAKYGDIIEIPTGAIQLDKLTADMVLRTYSERCSIVNVTVAEDDSKEVAKLKEEISKAKEVIDALNAENAELKERIEKLLDDSQITEKKEG